MTEGLSCLLIKPRIFTLLIGLLSLPFSGRAFEVKNLRTTQQVLPVKVFSMTPVAGISGGGTVTLSVDEPTKVTAIQLNGSSLSFSLSLPGKVIATLPALSPNPDGSGKFYGITVFSDAGDATTYDGTSNRIGYTLERFMLAFHADQSLRTQYNSRCAGKEQTFGLQLSALSTDPIDRIEVSCSGDGGTETFTDGFRGIYGTGEAALLGGIPFTRTFGTAGLKHIVVTAYTRSNDSRTASYDWTIDSDPTLPSGISAASVCNGVKFTLPDGIPVGYTAAFTTSDPNGNKNDITGTDYYTHFYSTPLALTVNVTLTKTDLCPAPCTYSFRYDYDLPPVTDCNGNHFLGNISGDMSNGANWSLGTSPFGVESLGQNVIIDGNEYRHIPSAPAGQSRLAFSSLVLLNSASILPSPFGNGKLTLEVHDNFTASGNIINNVIAENSINGHFNIRNLTLGGNTVTITGTLSVSKTLDAGKATTINTENGEVYLLATDVTNACNFLTDHPVSFIGNGFIYERLFDAASGVAEPYYNVALPLTGTRTLSTLFKGTGQRFQNGGTSTSSAYMYNPTLTDNQGWIYCQETDAIQAGTGFRMKFAGVGGNTVPLKILGNPFTDEPGINLNYCPSSCGYGTEENGWNLVGNPYNCALSFANVVSNGVEPFVYYFNTATRQYGMAGFDNSMSTRGATSTVANGQSFFVRANSAGANLYFKNSDRVNSFAPVTPRAAPENLLRITLKSGPETDETLIQFSPDAAPAYEQGTDAQKMFNQNLNLYTRSNNGKNLVLNRTNIPAGRTSLALAFSGASTGINVLSFEGAGALNNIGLMLCDRYTGETLVLSEGSQYAFSVSTDPASISPDRFTLQASTSVLGLTRLSKTVFELYPNPSTGLFNISGTETGRVKVINTVGELVSETTLGEGGSRTLNIAGQPAGMYRVTLQTAQGSQSRLVVKQ